MNLGINSLLYYRKCLGKFLGTDINYSFGRKLTVGQPVQKKNQGEKSNV